MWLHAPAGEGTGTNPGRRQSEEGDMSLYRYDPPLGSMTADAMRLASGGPVVCRTCGCRLQAPTTAEMDEDPAGSWRHFEGLPGRDARG